MGAEASKGGTLPRSARTSCAPSTAAVSTAVLELYENATWCQLPSSGSATASISWYDALAAPGDDVVAVNDGVLLPDAPGEVATIHSVVVVKPSPREMMP